MLFTSWLESIFNIVRMSNWLCLRHIKSALDKVDQLWSLTLFIKNQVITQNYCLSRWTYKIRTKDLFIHNIAVSYRISVSVYLYIHNSSSLYIPIKDENFLREASFSSWFGQIFLVYFNLPHKLIGQLLIEYEGHKTDHEGLVKNLRNSKLFVIKSQNLYIRTISKMNLFHLWLIFKFHWASSIMAQEFVLVAVHVLNSSILSSLRLHFR